MKNAIEIKNLMKKYDAKFELGSIDVTIPSGCIIGLIGENGAGKTTLIKSILNIIKIDSGDIKIFGQNYQNNEIKKDIAVVLDGAFFPETLTPANISTIMKDMYQNWDNHLFMKYMNDFQLPINSKIKTMSKGMRKKLEIAVALSHHPKLLILDEPTSGLDPVVRSEVLDIFMDFIKDDEHTILLSTHITSDLEHIADNIIFIDEGKIILNDDRSSILDNYAILKCDIDKFDDIDKNDIVAYKKQKYNYDILVTNKQKMKHKYSQLVIDNITLEELMVLMIKGEK